MNEKSNEIFLIELPHPKSLEVLTSFNYDYTLLSEFLDIKKNRLVILNPNKATKRHKGEGSTSRIEQASKGHNEKGDDSVEFDKQQIIQTG